MHHCEIKLRLTDEDDEFLRQLAKRNDIAKAVMGRILLRRAMYEQGQQPNELQTSDRRGAQGLYGKGVDS